MGHSFRLRVYYEDTDLAGIVYYANYFKFIERARSNALSAVGIDQLKLKATKMFFVVKKVEADFIAPAIFNDELLVTTELLEIKGARLNLRQIILRDDQIIFTSEIKLAFIFNDRPIKFSIDFTNKLKKIHQF
jgi:acyl-CoA thioester hydrolase